MMNTNVQALSVTDVNRYIKALVTTDEVLSAVAVRGEISNFKRHSAGHLYFTLKDSGGELAAVMFRADAARMSFALADGMRVVIYGNIDVYEKSGRYQLYARTVTADGAGAMAEAFKRLKEKLMREGLFDEARKKPLPKFPGKIGVITAPTGAAIRDILNITERRYPMAEILLYPSLVQGADAPSSLKCGVEYLNAEGSCDVIILGRGGGSAEDLWAFNDEELARAVAASNIPIISAVGHETDFTLCDFVADKRAPTPSAAAEIAVPDKEELKKAFAYYEEGLFNAASAIVEKRKSLNERLYQMLLTQSPTERLLRMKEQVAYKTDMANTLMLSLLDKRKGEYAKLLKQLILLDPLSVLSRGYSVVKDNNGRVIGSVKGLCEGENILITMSDGEAEAKILALKENI